MYKKDVEIHKIFSSPAHNYFTRKKFEQEHHPDITHNTVRLETGRGIQGDRFEFSKYPITFFSLEVAQILCHELELPLKLELFRRNIIISGINLQELIGEKFTLGDIAFEGLSHCSPCPWMNNVMKKGAYTFMRGRGGLRATPLQDGKISLGINSLESTRIIDTNPIAPLKHSKIPK
ncbi:MOSC domain-containing protein [Sulfurimonas sp.]